MANEAANNLWKGLTQEEKIEDLHLQVARISELLSTCDERLNRVLAVHEERINLLVSTVNDLNKHLEALKKYCRLGQYTIDAR